nr:hypothetical protein [uncultured Holophaga sp.]
MSEVERVYFIAGGRSLEAVKAWDALRQAAMGAFAAFFDKAGITKAEGTRTGHIFYTEGQADPLIPGFRHPARSSGWIFDRKTPEGKALAEEWASFYLPHASDLEVGVSPVMAGMRVHFAVPELVGDAWVLSCPCLCGKPKPEPFDSTPIKTSEYWAMKEASEALEGGTK